jgi:hypothetical protein
MKTVTLLLFLTALSHDARGQIPPIIGLMPSSPPYSTPVDVLQARVRFKNLTNQPITLGVSNLTASGAGILNKLLQSLPRRISAMARFCTACGTRNDDQAAFCEECGKPLRAAGAAATVAESHAAAPREEPAAKPALPPTPAPTPARQRRSGLVPAVLAGAILIVAGGGYAWWLSPLPGVSRWLGPRHPRRAAGAP